MEYIRILFEFFSKNISILVYCLIATIGAICAFITFLEWWYTYDWTRWIYVIVSIGFLFLTALSYKAAYKEENAINEKKTEEETKS